jgi:hypothetical protein
MREKADLINFHRELKNPHRSVAKLTRNAGILAKRQRRRFETATVAGSHAKCLAEQVNLFG